MPSVSNLIAGPLTVYTGPVGEALPELDDIAPSGITVTPAGNWVEVAYCMPDTDFEFTYTPTIEPVRVMPHTAAVTHILEEEEGEFAYALAESDFTAFDSAMSASALTTTASGADQTAQDKIGVGDGTLTRKALLLLGTNPDSGSRIIHVYRAVLTDPMTLTFAQQHKGFDVKWMFECDTAKTAGERLFKMYDITAAAAS